MRWLACSALALCASCSWDGPPELDYSCPDGRCPDGEVCRAGLCRPAVLDPLACDGTALVADGFDAELDPARWTVETDAGGSAMVVDGALEIRYQESGAGAAVRMIEHAPLDGASVAVEVAAPADISSSYIRLRLVDEGVTPLALSADTFELSATIDSDLDVPAILRSEDYRPQEQRFWRVRWAGEEICFQTSPDGDAYEDFACGSADGVRASLQLELSAGNYAGDEQAARFDSVNWCLASSE